MTRARIVLAVGLALIALLLGATLSGSPLVIVSSSVRSAEDPIAYTESGAPICQGEETVAAGVSALHIFLEADSMGSAVSVKVLSAGHLVTQGSVNPGWRGVGVTVPVNRVQHTVSHATVCVLTGPDPEHHLVRGERASPASSATRGGVPLPGRMEIEYLAHDQRSWWSLITPIARRMSLGRATGGMWGALLSVGFMLLAISLTAWLMLRGPSAGRAMKSIRARAPLPSLPLAAWVCFSVAFLNAAAWSFITPLFQVDDEQDHFAYVQQLAETHTLPTTRSNPVYSAEEETAMQDLRFEAIHNISLGQAIGAPAEERRLQSDLKRRPSRVGSGDAGGATSEPPLFYALQTIPYALGARGTILLRMQLMRLLSALMGGLTALFVFLFLREALPGESWAWSVGGVSVALTPLLGFISGSINPESMLTAVSAVIFYCLARGFRRGLTPSLSVAIGALSAVGFLTKLNFLGLAPGVLLGLLVLSLRAASTSKALAARCFTLGAAIAIAPVVVYTLVNALSNRPLLGLVSGSIGQTGHHGSLTGEISYIWQRYLPPLPGMVNDFQGLSPLRAGWFDGLVGQYGWDDISFPDWVNTAALLPALGLLALSLRAVVARRGVLRARLAEVVVYCAMAVGVLVLLGADAYLVYPEEVLGYRSPRYLLPMLAIAGALTVLAARGGGRRWGPATGTLIVLGLLAHDIFSQLLVISRFYG